jgi:hypothetical protein
VSRVNVTDFKALGVDIPEREITGLSPILLPSPSKEFTKKPLFVPGFTGFLKEPMKNEDLALLLTPLLKLYLIFTEFDDVSNVQSLTVIVESAEHYGLLRPIMNSVA